jgi:hypothetical protein
MLVYDLDHAPAPMHLRSTLTQFGLGTHYRALADRALGRFITVCFMSDRTEINQQRFATIDALLDGIKRAQISATAAGIGDLEIQHNVSPDVRPLIMALCVKTSRP